MVDTWHISFDSLQDTVVTVTKNGDVYRTFAVDRNGSYNPFRSFTVAREYVNEHATYGDTITGHYDGAI